jgi:hypothetical protein
MLPIISIDFPDCSFLSFQFTAWYAGCEDHVQIDGFGSPRVLDCIITGPMTAYFGLEAWDFTCYLETCFLVLLDIFF